MRDIAVSLLVFGSLPAILYRPWIGILVWTWLGFMNPHRLAWGFSLTFPFALIVALTTMVSLLISREEKKMHWTREMVLMLVFLLWTVVTTVNSFYPEFAYEQLIKVAKIFLMIFVAMILITNEERLKALVWVIALSLGFYGVKGGIFTLATGGGYAVRGPVGTFIDGNNEIGLALVMTVPLLYYLSRHAEKKYMRVAMLVSAVLTTFAALGTQSRGALLAVAAMATFLWVKSRTKLMTAVLIVMFVGILLPLLPDTWYQRMWSIENYEHDASAQGRLNAWGMAFNLASHRLTGGGFECFLGPTFWRYAPDPENVHDSHSIFFQVLGHHGFIGLALFLLIVGCTWFSARSVLKATKNDRSMLWLRDLMAMVQVSLIAYLSAGAFLGLAYFDYFYNLVLIVAVAQTIVARKAAGSSAGRRLRADGTRIPKAVAPVTQPVPNARPAV
jgi:probable O-glycosylation ligase (exosortase A-associated)